MKEKNQAVPDEVLSKEFISQFKTEADVSKFLKQLHAQVLEKMLEGEMDDHLGYEKNSMAGNNAAHANDGFVGRRESFFAVLNLYYIVGSIMLAWQVIDTLPDFDKELVPQSAKTSTLTVVPQPDQAQAATTQSADALAQAVAMAALMPYTR